MLEVTSSTPLGRGRSEELCGSWLPLDYPLWSRKGEKYSVAFGTPIHPLSFLLGSRFRWLEHTLRLHITPQCVEDFSTHALLFPQVVTLPTLSQKVLYYTPPALNASFRVSGDPRLVHFPVSFPLLSTHFQQPRREMGTGKQGR